MWRLKPSQCFVLFLILFGLFGNVIFDTFLHRSILFELLVHSSCSPSIRSSMFLWFSFDTGSSESAGVKALILPKGEEAFIRTLGITIPPGAHALVGINIKEVHIIRQLCGLLCPYLVFFGRSILLVADGGIFGW